MAIHYSKYFHVTHKNLVNKGVYNGCIDKDSQLHIDPILLKDCKIPEFTNAYEEFLLYFRGFVSLTRAATCNNTNGWHPNFFLDNNIKSTIDKCIAKRNKNENWKWHKRALRA